jgi:hypothetical protein
MLRKIERPTNFPFPKKIPLLKKRTIGWSLDFNVKKEKQPFDFFPLEDEKTKQPHNFLY